MQTLEEGLFYIELFGSVYDYNGNVAPYCNFGYILDDLEVGSGYVKDFAIGYVQYLLKEDFIHFEMFTESNRLSFFASTTYDKNTNEVFYVSEDDCMYTERILVEVFYIKNGKKEYVYFS